MTFDPTGPVIAHLATGALLAAWLMCRVQTRRPLDRWDHTVGMALTFLGPLAALAVAADIIGYGVGRKVRP